MLLNILSFFYLSFYPLFAIIKPFKYISPKFYKNFFIFISFVENKILKKEEQKLNIKQLDKDFNRFKFNSISLIFKKNYLNKNSINKIFLLNFYFKKLFWINKIFLNNFDKAFLFSYLSFFKVSTISLEHGKFSSFRAFSAYLLNFYKNKRIDRTFLNQKLEKKVNPLLVKIPKILNPIKLIPDFFNKIKFNVSSIDLNLLKFNTFLINIIRSFKVFNKGRYSRNRQYYRTGVYWCLYINIIAVVGMYYWFYRFTMNFGYIWWLFFAFIFTFFFSKFFKFNFFYYKEVIFEILSILNWLGLIILNIYIYTYKLLNSLKKNFFHKEIFYKLKLENFFLLFYKFLIKNISTKNKKN